MCPSLQLARHIARFLAVLVMLAPMTCLADDPPQLLLQWGSAGTGLGQFHYPQGLGVDQDGNVYVTDLNRVQKFSNDGVFLGSIGGLASGSGPGQFYYPLGVAVDPLGNIYVADNLNGRIQVFDNQFHYLREWPVLAARPYIALDPSGAFAYVAQAGYSQSPGHVFKFDTATGSQVAAWVYQAYFGNTTYGMSTGPDGSLYVAEHTWVTCFSSNGDRLAQWGALDNTEFAQPAGVAVGPDGTVYVGDLQRSRIDKLTSTGTIAASFSLPGDMEDFAVDHAGNIFMFGPNSNVQKWGNVATPAIRDTWGRLKQLYR